MLQIHPLSEGEFTIGHDKLFVPFDSNHDVLEDRPTGSLLVEVQPFLIVTDTDYILLDTGLGFNLPNGKLQIHHNLAKLGVSPMQITKVIMSHLHKDHAGGISFINGFGFRELTFPNADYIIYKAEFDYALVNTTASYLKDEFAFLAQSNNAIFYTEENGEIAPGISHQFSGGHSAHHQVIKITEGQQTIFYAGDEASQMKQLKIRYIAKYDFNGRLAADLRDMYAAQGKENDYTFLFYHDTKFPFGKLG
jgi:glyoxylase-like metal-dependent hydrolase (beta-lactamase superfamily II)